MPPDLSLPTISFNLRFDDNGAEEDDDDVITTHLKAVQSETISTTGQFMAIPVSSGADVSVFVCHDSTCPHK